MPYPRGDRPLCYPAKQRGHGTVLRFVLGTATCRTVLFWLPSSRVPTAMPSPPPSPCCGQGRTSLPSIPPTSRLPSSPITPLVFLSDPAPAVEAEVPAWVLLHPSGANRAIATLGSAREEIDQPCLADLVALLDRALTLVAPASGAGLGGASASSLSRSSRVPDNLAQKD